MHKKCKNDVIFIKLENLRILKNEIKRNIAKIFRLFVQTHYQVKKKVQK